MSATRPAAMTFGRAFRSTYADAAAFLIACPLLALVPAAFELLQHVVEVRIGMYDSVVAAKAVEHDPARMVSGFVKVAALMVPQYWIVRFAASRDRRYAIRPDPQALRLFGAFLGVMLVLVAIQLFALPETGTMLVVSLVGSQLIGSLFAVWGIAAPLGNARIGPHASVALILPLLPWTFAFLIVAILPLMIPHYLLGALALLGPKPLLWPGLIVDSLLVSWLTTVMVTSTYHAALRAAARADVEVVPATLARTASVEPA